VICAFAPCSDQSRVQRVVEGQIGEESAWKSDSTEEEARKHPFFLRVKLWRSARCVVSEEANFG
jgi:hypothetical protein